MCKVELTHIQIQRSACAQNGARREAAVPLVHEVANSRESRLDAVSRAVGDGDWLANGSCHERLCKYQHMLNAVGQRGQLQWLRSGKDARSSHLKWLW